MKYFILFVACLGLKGLAENTSCTLIITYDNGKTKKIDDYGLLGSFGLNKAYDLLYKLRENQDWK